MEKKPAAEEIRRNLNLGPQGYETAALLTMSEEEALKVYEYLKKTGIQASYVDRNSSSFKKGLTVTTFYLAKGLEFDQVFVLARRKKTPLLIQQSISVLPGLSMNCTSTNAFKRSFNFQAAGCGRT